MQLNTLFGLTSVLATLASAAPAANSASIQKRNECVFFGQWAVDAVVGGGGPGQAPVSSSTGSLWIEYLGGVTISPDLNGDPITESTQSFTAADTRLPNDITWSADFDLGYSSCTVVYEGVTYTGGAATPPSQPAGGSAWQCQVNFGCEGGISELTS